MVVTIKLTDNVARIVRAAISVALEDGSVGDGGQDKKTVAAMEAVQRQITQQLKNAK